MRLGANGAKGEGAKRAKARKISLFLQTLPSTMLLSMDGCSRPCVATRILACHKHTHTYFVCRALVRPSPASWVSRTFLCSNFGYLCLIAPSLTLVLVYALGRRGSLSRYPCMCVRACGGMFSNVHFVCSCSSPKTKIKMCILL